MSVYRTTGPLVLFTFPTSYDDSTDIRLAESFKSIRFFVVVVVIFLLFFFFFFLFFCCCFFFQKTVF